MYRTAMLGRGVVAGTLILGVVSFLFSVAIAAAQNQRVDELILKLGSSDPGARSQAAAALGEIGDPRAVEPLIAALGDTHSAVQQAAASALGQIKDVRAVEPLLATLKDPASNVRNGAARVLGVIGDARAVGPLIAAITDKDSDVRSWAVYALELIGSPGVEALNAALESKDLGIVAGAYAFFIRVGKAGTEDTLIAALDEHGDRGMAEDFLNCGNSQLYAAALRWGSKHGYSPESVPGGPYGLKWGQK
jgi:HEAT repeat protein